MTLAQRRKRNASMYHDLAQTSKALSSPRRLELLDLLCQRPWTVEALAAEGRMSIANASQHLKILRSARLVNARKQGLFVEYSVARPEVCAMFRGFIQP